jgi:PPM family protein phosphatase
MSADSADPRPPPLQLEWSGLTHPGRFRKNNEDTFLALAFNGHEVTYLGKVGQSSLGPHDFVFAVSDGMGGAAAGEFASRITVEKITRLLPRSFRASAAGLSVDFADVIPELFEAIHKALIFLGSSYEECAGMGATLSLAWFTPGWMYFGHIGDSRIYYLPAAGGITQVTHDHSHVGWLRRSGRINEREQRTHPAKNSLQQALGAGHQIVEPQVGAVGCEPGDRFLLCSDGLIDGLWDRQLEEMVRSLPIAEAARHLVQESVAASGRDNTTALVLEVRS